MWEFGKQLWYCFLNAAEMWCFFPVCFNNLWMKSVGIYGLSKPCICKQLRFNEFDMLNVFGMWCGMTFMNCFKRICPWLSYFVPQRKFQGEHKHFWPWSHFTLSHRSRNNRFYCPLFSVWHKRCHRNNNVQLMAFLEHALQILLATFLFL